MMMPAPGTGGSRQVVLGPRATSRLATAPGSRRMGALAPRRAAPRSMQCQRRSRRPAARRLRATLLLTSALCVPAARARPETAPPCEDSDAVAVFSSPRVPRHGAVLRVVAVAERKLAATLVVLDPEGQPVG